VFFLTVLPVEPAPIFSGASSIVKKPNKALLFPVGDYLPYRERNREHFSLLQYHNLYEVI